MVQALNEKGMYVIRGLKIKSVAYHRNGVAGEGFHVVTFTEGTREDKNKVAILFETEGQCAVLGVDKLAAGDIVFGSNSWRGDDYEPQLREAIAKWNEA